MSGPDTGPKIDLSRAPELGHEEEWWAELMRVTREINREIGYDPGDRTNDPSDDEVSETLD